MAHGQGIETRPDGTIRHEGRWEHDRPIRNEESVDKDAVKRGWNGDDDDDMGGVPI